MENKYTSVDIKKRTLAQRSNDLVILQQLALLCGEKAIDRVKESSLYKDNELYYPLKLFLLGQKQNFLQKTQINFKGKPEEEQMQYAMAVIFHNWNRYKNLNILKEIDRYCHDSVSRIVPGQNINRFKFISKFYISGSGKCNMNVCQLVYDIVDPERQDKSIPNPKFDDENAVKEFRIFTETLEKESGVDEYQLV